MVLNQTPNTGFLDIPKILEVIPISKSSWWAGVKSGKYPKPIKHGGRTFWKAQDIQELIEAIEKAGA